MKKVVNLVHEMMSEYLHHESIAVDFTMGNGHDTLFLAKHTSHVYAFDISNEAISKTKALLENHGINHPQLIFDSHHHVDAYLSSYDVGVFNFGYLPQSKEFQPTLLKTSRIAVEKALLLLNPKGLLVLVLYPGHEEGKEESEYFDQYLKSLDSKDYHISLFKMVNIETSPYVYFIEKSKKAHY